jgi:hypothetical protein
LSTATQFIGVTEGRSTSIFIVKDLLGLPYREVRCTTLLRKVRAYLPQCNLPEDLNLCTTSPLQRPFSQIRTRESLLESKNSYRGIHCVVNMHEFLIFKQLTDIITTLLQRANIQEFFEEYIHKI